MTATAPDRFTSDLFRLDGRKALVTGGATGIGRAIGLVLAAAGADVAITFRSHPPEATLAAIEAAGVRAAAIQADFETFDREAAERIVAATRTQLGGLDILVNNAGIIHRQAAEELAFADWRRVLAVDLDAVWLIAQAAGRQMLQQGVGKIVNVASVLSFEGGLKVPAYASGKHALVGLTRALANEWAQRGINVNAIAPGYTATDNTQALRDDRVRSKELLSRIPAGRFADPAEIAGAAVFLASDAASYCHGTVIVVDGGWLAR
jgi:2-dehydro-3-deoxy-D-gluconate 5-dehydrogenase